MDAEVLKVLSSCCAAVPAANMMGTAGPGDQAMLADTSISLTFIASLSLRQITEKEDLQHLYLKQMKLRF